MYSRNSTQQRGKPQYHQPTKTNVSPTVKKENGGLHLAQAGHIVALVKIKHTSNHVYFWTQVQCWK